MSEAEKEFVALGKSPVEGLAEAQEELNKLKPDVVQDVSKAFLARDYVIRYFEEGKYKGEIAQELDFDDYKKEVEATSDTDIMLLANAIRDKQTGKGPKKHIHRDKTMMNSHNRMNWKQRLR
jgi:hypothetical protein